ncbi:MAG: crossover junction endodeoxyribonuclease RuvC [Acetobacteraceae bacterium]
MLRLLGLDPGLGVTGWGVIATAGSRLSPLACGAIKTDSSASVPERLRTLHQELSRLLALYAPEEAAIEETFVNRNGAASLKLGYARGVALLAPALAGIPIAEYAARTVKQAVVGTGAASKHQVAMMVRCLLPGVLFQQADAADALAVAICHAHHRSTRSVWAAADRRHM